MNKLHYTISMLAIGALVGLIVATYIAGSGKPIYTIESTPLTIQAIEYTVYADTPWRHDAIFKTQSAEQAWGIWFGLSNNVKIYEAQIPTPGEPVPNNGRSGQRYDPDNPGITQKAVPIR
jgi:hypothetical protein